MSNNKLKSNEIFKGIVGLVLFLISLYSPYYLLNSYRPQLLDSLFTSESVTVHALILILVTLVLVGITTLIVKFINNNILKMWAKPVGIILIAILSTIPALAIRNYDCSFNSLGIVYFITIIVASLSWASLNMIGTFIKIFKNNQ